MVACGRDSHKQMEEIVNLLIAPRQTSSVQCSSEISNLDNITLQLAKEYTQQNTSIGFRQTTTNDDMDWLLLIPDQKEVS